MTSEGVSTDRDRLDAYRDRRDFSATPEPPGGGSGARGAAPRFVIQEHHARRLHWDLRLERDGVLASWAIPNGIPEEPGRNHLAPRTEDHPLAYLDFEGEIPPGSYGAGRMRIWDRGIYETLTWEPKKVEVILHGERLDGRFALFAMGGEGEAGDWMIHRMDPPADPDREAMPEALVPMAAGHGPLPPDEAAWAFELDWDGTRAIAHSRPGRLWLRDRSLRDITERVPEVSRLNRALSSHSAVLDGTITCLDPDGRPSVAASRRRMSVDSRGAARRLARTDPVTYVIFDLLWLDGHSLMARPYADRRRLLSDLDLNGEAWRVPAHLVGRGAALLEASAARGLDGLVAKRLDSPYQPGARSTAWVRVGSPRRGEFVVGGWLRGPGADHAGVDALALGVWEGDELRYVGTVETGVSARERDRLTRLLVPLRRDTSPFSPAGSAPPGEVVFCAPQLVCQVEFAGWARDGRVRLPSYQGLCDDRSTPSTASGGPARGEGPPGSPVLMVTETRSGTGRVQVDGRELALSNLDKVLYPATGFAKRDLITYYGAIAPTLLAHLAGRPLTVKRYPDGVEGKAFYQKQTPAHRPDWVRTVPVASGRRAWVDHMLVEDAAGVVWLANLAAIELHTPLARVEAPDRPTTLVFDLDPGAPATIVECCHVGLVLRGMCDALGLESFAKTSGAKGLQVYVPLNTDVGFDETKGLALRVAELLADAQPERVVSRQARALRAGKVLIDWSQNDGHKTTVCAYSLRAGERPTVSAPVAWDEVRLARDAGDPAVLSFDAAQVVERVADRGDLFAPVLSLIQAFPRSTTPGVGR
ncbi:MAG TPA: DNA ligase D [Acidimicrobiales bacterium]|nr:DNA ligase D [Acidimicrobiales bacterium]